MTGRSAPACARKARPAWRLSSTTERPQSPLIRGGPRGAGQWRRASWDEALGYIAEKLKGALSRPRWAWHGAFRSRRPFQRPDPGVRAGARLAELLQPRRRLRRGNAHNAARSIYGFGHEGLIPDLAHVEHLVPHGCNIVESLMVKEAKAFMSAVANGMRVTYRHGRSASSSSSHPTRSGRTPGRSTASSASTPARTPSHADRARPPRQTRSPGSTAYVTT